jgi:hypothetical protein
VGGSGAERPRHPQNPGVTIADVQLSIRPPLWARVGIAVFLPVWCYFFFLSDHEGAAGLVGYVVALVAIAFVARMAFLSVVGTADGRLTVRNRWSTRTFERHEIDDVEIDRAEGRSGQGWAAFLCLQDGSRHRLDVTEVPFRRMFGRSLESDAESVRAWVAGRPQPFV